MYSNRVTGSLERVEENHLTTMKSTIGNIVVST